MARDQVTKTLFRETTHYRYVGDSVRWRGWVIAVFAALLCVVMFVGVSVLGFWLSSVSCRQFGDQMTLETEYRIPSGCYVSIDGAWIPAGAYRATEGVDR